MPKDNGKEPTQKTQPRRDEGAEGEPFDIPIPKRADVLAALQKATQPRSGKRDGRPHK